MSAMVTSLAASWRNDRLRSAATFTLVNSLSGMITRVQPVPTAPPSR